MEKLNLCCLTALCSFLVRQTRKFWRNCPFVQFVLFCYFAFTKLFWLLVSQDSSVLSFCRDVEVL